ncbi:WD40 repeat domain-containing protein [Cellulomonas sp.]|uniref:WD40 repeat domain-containing protein n=1 Tax=Cellulomonas sp. TaxID=40001 RepID=UPI003BA94799
MTADATAVRADNPYVGPTSFQSGDPLYGRSQARDDLLDLVIAERIVLLYSPSGAGKTSLIQAALVHALEEARFEVLPVIRVTHALSADASVPDVRNRYVMSTLLSLEEGVPAAQQVPLSTLATMSISDYLAARPDLDGVPGNEVLIFDQFEEVLTADPTDEAAKREFFAQLGEMLRDREHWAVFAMREDFLAALDPYLRFVPTRFRTRYRLDLLTAAQALEAVVNPARDSGVAFATDAAARLVDDLRRVRVQRPDGAQEVLGPYVEPVQLQVACHLLWSRLPTDAREITEADGAALGDVEEALARYYADRVRDAAKRTGLREGAVRDWFDERLITPQGLRGQVLDGPTGDVTTDRALLDALIADHLVRAESRRQATWYELAHDRFIEPIRKDNAVWRGEHLTILERTAALWAAEERPQHLLLVGPALEDALRDASLIPGQLRPRERELLEASQAAEAHRRSELRSARRMRRISAVLAAAVVVALVASVWGWVSFRGAKVAELRQHLQFGALQALTRDPQTGVALADAYYATLDGDRLDPDTRALLYQAADASPVSVVFRSDDTQQVNSAVLSQDGTAVVTTDGTAVRVFDRGTGAPVTELEPPVDDVVTSVDVSGDGGTVVAALLGGTVVTWDVATGRSQSWDSGSDFGWSVAISRAGDRVASLAGDDEIRVWDDSGEPLLDLHHPGDEWVNSVTFSDDGRYLATVADSLDAMVWDAGTGAAVAQIPMGEGTWSATFGPDGTSLGTIALDGTASVWDIATGARTSGPLDMQADSRALSTDLTKLLTMTAWGDVQILDIATGTLEREAFVAGARLAGAGFDSVDPTAAFVLPTIGNPAIWLTESVRTTDLVASEGGSVVVSSDDGSLLVTHVGDLTGTLLTGDGAFAWEVDVDAAGDRTVAVRTGRAVVWDESAEAPGPVLKAAGDAEINAAAISADGARVVTAASDGTVSLWDAQTGARDRDLIGPDWTKYVSVDFSADGSLVLVVLGADTNNPAGQTPPMVAAVLPVDGTDPLVRLQPTDDQATDSRFDQAADAAFSPDGRLVAIGTEAGTLTIVDAATGDVIRDGALTAQRVNDVGFTPDGRVLSSSSDLHVRIIDPRSGHVDRDIALVDSWPMGAVAAADGSSVTVFARDGSVTTLPLHDDDLIDLFRSKVTRDLWPHECEQYDITTC